MMNEAKLCLTRPKLKTKGFSTYHIYIFELMLLKKTNKEINEMLGYTKRSHAIVDLSRKVMCKLLAMENLSKKDHGKYIVYPRDYCFWWKKLIYKHQKGLRKIAVEPMYYKQE